MKKRLLLTIITFAALALLFTVNSLLTVDRLPPINHTSKFQVTREKTLKEIMSIPVSPTTSISQDVEDEIERMAEEMPYLSKSDLLYNRLKNRPIFVRPNDKFRFNKILNALSDPKFNKETLLFLLGHKNPKVRTLAIIGIYQFEDPTIIPALLPLIKDSAPTFDGTRAPMSAHLMASQFELEPQTVGEIAFEIVNFYVNKGTPPNYSFNPTYQNRRTRSIPKAFIDYWKLHKSREFYAGWFAVKLVRARSARAHRPDGRLTEIKRVRDEIDKIPLDDRLWTLLWLRAQRQGHLLATEEELIEFCKAVGTDKLVQVLQRQIPTSDPDLLPNKSGNWPYKQMCYFILEHAQEILEPKNIEDLQACEAYEINHDVYRISDPTITSLWSIARAQLMEPDEGVAELRQAYDQFPKKYQLDDRTKISLALWKIGGTDQQGFLTDWFYQEINNRDHEFRPLVQFIDTVLADKEQPGLQLIKRIVADKRFNQINWKPRDLERMESKLKHWRGKLLGP